MTFKEFLKRIADKWFCLHEWKLEEEFVNDIIPVEKLKTVYTPQLVDSIKWNEDFNDNFFENHKKEFLKVWFSLFKKNPRIYLESSSIIKISLQ